MTAALASALAVPGAPRWSVDWDALRDRFDWVRRMDGTPQDPVHHAEGDVAIHTRLVCSAMAGLAAFRDLDDDSRLVAFAGALLHDVAKPDCTRSDDDGRVTAHGHSVRGAMHARRLLWRLGMPFAMREQVVGLVRHHQAPFWLLERADPHRLVATISQTVRCDWLALLAESDARGRTCADPQRILDNVELFRAYCEENGCLSAPFAFPTAHARFLYLGGRQRDALHAPHEDFRCEVVLMAGFPGAGKDRWIAENLAGWPIVSLDRLRQELDVDPEDDQGSVVARAREAAREHLRAGRSFVWNATNVSRRIRAQCTRIFADYGARIRIVYVEVPEPTLRAQNRGRRAPVPEHVLDSLLEKWEVPDLTEAHEVVYAVRPVEAHRSL
ncbi:MAG TPA: AAA family ATPase [Labilithrix sp.]|nr:AAA family ATPase [Labilithrix sp.]